MAPVGQAAIIRVGVQYGVILYAHLAGDRRRIVWFATPSCMCCISDQLGSNGFLHNGLPLVT
jgi:hypothetical protein